MRWLVVLVMPFAFALGWLIAGRKRKNHQDVEWDALQARLNHARDLSMRMGELAQNQNKLADEQRHLDGLINMKAGSHAMLSDINAVFDLAPNSGELSSPRTHFQQRQNHLESCFTVSISGSIVG